MIITNLMLILLQSKISTEHLNDAVKSGNVNEVLIWIVGVLFVILVSVSGLLWGVYQKKQKQLENSKDEYANKVDEMSRSYNNKIDDINREFGKKIDDLYHQFYCYSFYSFHQLC
jgi:beta-lactamase regulating signal transducer with metallopeptidase domain